MTAKKFLSAFHHGKYTLAYFKGNAMRSFPCAPKNLEKAITLLQEKNSDHEIYFMVNEGDGILSEKKSACHSTDNVISLSAIFLDAELSSSNPLPAIEEFCAQLDLPYSICVESSPNRYHIYWLLAETPATPQNIHKWKQIQSLLHSKFSIDRTMTDIPQVLRIPEFTNIKKSCPVTLKHLSQTRYSLDDIYQTIKRTYPELSESVPFTPLQPVTETYRITPGERHEELLRRARKLYTLPLSDSEIKCFIDGIIQNHVDENVDFLPSGKRYSEVERILAAAKTYAEQERQKELQEVIVKVTSRKKSSFELDPDFYYQAPGLVGDITRYMVDTSDYPIPAHAFAAAVSLVGFTKARYIQGARQLPPLNYFLCLAPSGSGKTTIQDMVKEALSRLKISHLLEDGIASAQGLIQFLSNSHNIGLIMYDEVKDLFQTISNKNASSYEVKISLELTKLYTAYKSTYTPPTTKTHKGKKIVLHKPLFSFIGFGHHTLVDQLFTKNNVMEGLLPRFLILNVAERIERSSRYAPIPQSYIDQLQYHLTKSCIVLEEKLESADIPVNTDPTIQTLSLSTEAQSLYQSFKDKTNELYTGAVAARNGLEALFSRGCEQSLRLALALSTDSINAQSLDFSIQLVSAQMQSFYAQFSETVNKTDFGKETDELLDTVIDMCSQSKDCTISKRDLQRKTQSRYKTARLFHDHLTSLIEQERITEFYKDTGTGRKQSRLRLDDVI